MLTNWGTLLKWSTNLALHTYCMCNSKHIFLHFLFPFKERLRDITFLVTVCMWNRCTHYRLRKHIFWHSLLKYWNDNVPKIFYCKSHVNWSCLLLMLGHWSLRNDTVWANQALKIVKLVKPQWFVSIYSEAVLGSTVGSCVEADCGLHTKENIFLLIDFCRKT